jgi:hypothetical protein
MTDGTDVLTVVCSPNLGILDNWLPVVTAAKERDPALRVVLVVPHRSTVLLVDPDDTLVALTDAVVDEVLFRTVDGGVVVARSLVEARRLARSERLGTLAQRLIDSVAWRIARRRPSDHPTSGPLRALVRLLRPRALRGADVDPAVRIGSHPMLCYDVYVHLDEPSRWFLAALGPVPRASIHHGLDIVRPDERLRAVPSDPALDVAVSLFSELERPGYLDRHGLSGPAVRVVGVPRHERAWVERVVATSSARHRIDWDDVVFVVSRPGGPSYLPAERKVAALAAIHRIACEERGLRLVVKLHPKETDDGTIGRGLPAADEGATWMRVRAHPFHVARHALVAVGFWSGVLADMVALGVPAIEYLDVRGLPEHDRPGVELDARGRPVFTSLRAHGLVLPADDADEFAAHLDRVLADRAGVLAEQRSAHARVLHPAEGAIDRALGGLGIAPR